MSSDGKKKPTFMLVTNAVNPVSPFPLNTRKSATDPFSPSYDPLPAFLSLGEYIGQGTTSVLRKGRKKHNGELVAVKIIKIFDPEIADIEMERLNILSSFRHPNIICCSAVINKLHVSNVILAFMELINGPNLTEFVTNAKNGRLQESISCSLLEQLMNALDFIHMQRVTHRDLKPDNIMLKLKSWPSNGVQCENEFPTLKLVDFNSAAKLSAGGGMSVTGTALYRAPECGNLRMYTELCDVWAAGLCLFFMMAGEDYFSSHMFLTNEEYYEWQTNYIHNFRCDSRFDDISNNGIRVLSLCLQKDPLDRPTPRMLLWRGASWFITHLGEDWAPKTKEYDEIVLGVTNTCNRCGLTFSSVDSSKANFPYFEYSREYKKKELDFFRTYPGTKLCGSPLGTQAGSECASSWFSPH